VGHAGITLRKLEFDEIVNRWDELKSLSKNALNDTRNLTQIGKRYETTMARFLLLCEQGVAQIWISSEGGKDRYLCLTFIGTSALSGQKNFTIYSIVSMTHTKRNLFNHWQYSFSSMNDFAKRQGCEKVTMETDLDYLVDTFRSVAPSGIIRQTMQIDL
jgi:hypothetical protein